MRQQLVVVTDSTADIAPSMAADLGLTVVPLSVTIDGQTMQDGAISQAEFFSRMKAAPQLPTTSQPAPGAFIEAYEKGLAEADHVVSVHISNRLSGTIESARQAAERFAGKVTVFDSLNLSWGLAWQAVGAARKASSGAGLDETISELERLRAATKLIVGLDSLDNLARGGRIGRVSAMLGSMLNLKVTLTVDEAGEFVPLARSRGAKAGLEHTLEWVAEQMGEAKRGSFAIGHAMEPDRANWIADRLREQYEVAELVIYETGCVISTHTGTGWGVAVVPAR